MQFFIFIVVIFIPFSFVHAAQPLNCSGYEKTDDLNKAVQDNFYVGQAQQEAEEILINKCQAKAISLKLKNLPIINKKNISYFWGNDSTSVKIVYKHNKIWEVFSNFGRILPREPIALKLPEFKNRPSLEAIKKDPSLFKFEYFPTKKELISALEMIFPEGTPRKKIEDTLVSGGKAKIGSFKRHDPKTDQVTAVGISYIYELATEDDREYEMAKRRVKAIYNQDDTLKELMLGGTIINLKE